MDSERQRPQRDQLRDAYPADQQYPGRLRPDEPGGHRPAAPVAAQHDAGREQLDARHPERTGRLGLADQAQRQGAGEPGQLFAVQPGRGEAGRAEQAAQAAHRRGQDAAVRCGHPDQQVEAVRRRGQRDRGRGRRETQQPGYQLAGQLGTQPGELPDAQADLAQAAGVQAGPGLPDGGTAGQLGECGQQRRLTDRPVRYPVLGEPAADPAQRAVQATAQVVVGPAAVVAQHPDGEQDALVPGDPALGELPVAGGRDARRGTQCRPRHAADEQLHVYHGRVRGAGR